MKKLILTLSIVLSSIAASAQSEGYMLPDGFFSVELQANPFSNDFNTFKMAEFKVRLFLDAKNVVRLKLGAGYDNDTDESTENYDSRLVVRPSDSYYTTTTKSQTKTKQTALKVALGYENHFLNTGRLDFYVGAEVGYEAKFYSGNRESNYHRFDYSGSEVTETSTYTKYSFEKMTPVEVSESFFASGGSYNSSGNYNSTPTTYDQSSSARQNRSINSIPAVDYNSAKQNESVLFANIFTGVDFFVYKGLYIGTELGVSFKTGKQKNGSWSYESLDSNGIKTVYNSKTGKLMQIDSTWKGNSGETGVLKEENREIEHFTRKNSNFKVYVEPALRIGWMF